MLQQKFKQFVNKVVTTTVREVVYTCPTDVDSVILKDFTVLNDNDAGQDAIVVEMWINGVKFGHHELDSRATIFGEKAWTIVLNPGETIELKVSTANKISVYMSGAEFRNV